MGVALPRFEVTEVRIRRTGGDTVEEALWRPINVTLVNVGQWDAVLLRECIVFDVSDILPIIPDYSKGRVRELGFRFPVEARAAHEISAAAGGMDANGEPFGIDPFELDRVATGPSVLWVYGYIIYRDFLDESCQQGLLRSAGN